jgi:RHS repeat-associated protein
LVRIELPGGTEVSYGYDALGRRIEKNVGGTVTRYVYDQLHILLELDGTNDLVARYTHGDGVDQPLALQRDGESYFYHVDHLGSVRRLTDAAGATANAYEYDSFGRLRSAVVGVANPFTYTGREHDAESGLYYYRSRYYDPHTGRFLNGDPLGLGGGDPTLYAYAGNNPANTRDPFGLIAPLIGVAIVLVIGAEAAFTAGVIIKSVKDRRRREARRQEAEDLRKKRREEAAAAAAAEQQASGPPGDPCEEVNLSEEAERTARAGLPESPVGSVDAPYGGSGVRMDDP